LVRLAIFFTVGLSALHPGRAQNLGCSDALREEREKVRIARMTSGSLAGSSTFQRDQNSLFLRAWYSLSLSSVVEAALASPTRNGLGGDYPRLLESLGVKNENSYFLRNPARRKSGSSLAEDKDSVVMVPVSVGSDQQIYRLVFLKRTTNAGNFPTKDMFAYEILLIEPVSATRTVVHSWLFKQVEHDLRKPANPGEGLSDLRGTDDYFGEGHPYLKDRLAVLDQANRAGNALYISTSSGSQSVARIVDVMKNLAIDDPETFVSRTAKALLGHIANAEKKHLMKASDVNLRPLLDSIYYFPPASFGNGWTNTTREPMGGRGKTSLTFESPADSRFNGRALSFEVPGIDEKIVIVRISDPATRRIEAFIVPLDLLKAGTQERAAVEKLVRVASPTSRWLRDLYPMIMEIYNLGALPNMVPASKVPASR
jgi:hypothetical protein